MKARKEGYDEGEKFGFKKGLETLHGRFGKRMCPERVYPNNRAIKDAIFHAVLGSIKNWEDTHGKLAMGKKQNKNSLAKRIAGNMMNVFERVECSLAKNKIELNQCIGSPASPENKKRRSDGEMSKQ
jgi:hypothetical protein